jgi:hypothetical protein
MDAWVMAGTRPVLPNGPFVPLLLFGNDRESRLRWLPPLRKGHSRF